MMIEKITIIILSITVLYLMFKDRVIQSYRRYVENRRETRRQRIRLIVEEVLQEIIKE